MTGHDWNGCFLAALPTQAGRHFVVSTAAGMIDSGVRPGHAAHLRLLLLCARAPLVDADIAAIRQILSQGVDWTAFAKLALRHDLAGVAAHYLTQTAKGLVPSEVLDALQMTLDQARRRNHALFEELQGVLVALSKAHVAAIPFKKPVLALYLYGDLGLGGVGCLDLLVHSQDLSSTTAVLAGLGYDREGALSAPQIEMIQDLRGQDILLKRTTATVVDLHTRLTPLAMALDIDYEALWDRARPRHFGEFLLLTPAPEDHFILLAVHGCRETWSKIKCASDIAAFVGTHPNLHWTQVLVRARLQGCLRMVLLATALASRCFGVVIPDQDAAAQCADPAIERMVKRIVGRWQVETPLGASRSRLLSIDWLRLHDGFARRARYVARALFQPRPDHVAAFALPGRLRFAYVPITFTLHIAMPLRRVSRQLVSRAGRLRAALATSRLGLALLPGPREAKRFLSGQHRARADAERALVKDPHDAGSWYSLGNALLNLGRHEQAVACYDKALAVIPDSTAIWTARGRALGADNRASSFGINGEDARMPAPRDADTWARYGGYLLARQRFAEANAASDQALAINPRHLGAMRIGLRSRASACDWRSWSGDRRKISEAVRAGQNIITPFNHRALCESEEEHFIVAQQYWRGHVQPDALWKNRTYHHDRIRIAYLSAELHDHPLAVQIVGVFEHHDRARFETTAISLGPVNRGAMRRRAEAGVERFIDARAMSDAEIAAMMREMEIDIAVDLNGHAGAGRPGILSHRPAPVQLTCLAYTGTMGASFIDYIIADRIVIPSDHFRYYTEKVVYLPNSYQCNDSRRAVPERTPSRAEAGLPDSGFVYCCFNNTHKITPPMFDIWMRLLTALPGSVLWLLGDNPYAMHNLRREATARGVAPARLVFAPRVPADDHLARHRLADLFLDTLPYNAHATGADALWAGLPLLTCRGTAFPGRVGASMLSAVGLPELITTSPTDYEELALSLARDPDRLAGLRSKLFHNRGIEPLFDTRRFTADLESAYANMWERQQAGLAPVCFAVSG